MIFETALFLIFFALLANLRVWTDSSTSLNTLEAVQTRVVLELPPSDSLRKKVNLESRKGMCGADSVKCFMQIPRVVSDRLIFLASSSVFPVAPVFEMRSLPAYNYEDITIYKIHKV